MKFRMLTLTLACIAVIPPTADAAQCPATDHTTYLQFIRADFGDGVKNYATVLQLPQGVWGKEYEGLMPDPNNPPYTMPCDCPAAHQDCDNKSYRSCSLHTCSASGSCLLQCRPRPSSIQRERSTGFGILG